MACLRLLANRFSGMTGESLTAEQRARLLRQNRGGISDHSTLVTIFTSNYPLAPASRALLSALPMFSHLLELQVTAIAHDDRRAFSLGFLQHLVGDALAKVSLSLDRLSLDVSLDHGDIRDLVRASITPPDWHHPLAGWLIGLVPASLCSPLQVRRLHVIAFFASQAAHSLVHGSCPRVSLLVRHGPVDGHVDVFLQPAADTAKAVEQQPWVRLTGLTERLFLPVERPLVDERSQAVVQGLSSSSSSSSSEHHRGLGHVLDYFFHGVLTPAVVVSQSKALVSALVDHMAALPHMHSLRAVDAARHKIVKSLYEGSEVRAPQSAVGTNQPLRKLRESVMAWVYVCRCDACVTTSRPSDGTTPRPWSSSKSTVSKETPICSCVQAQRIG